MVDILCDRLNCVPSKTYHVAVFGYRAFKEGINEVIRVGRPLLQ